MCGGWGNKHPSKVFRNAEFHVSMCNLTQVQNHVVFVGIYFAVRHANTLMSSRLLEECALYCYPVFSSIKELFLFIRLTDNIDATLPVADLEGAQGARPPPPFSDPSIQCVSF